MNDVSSPLCHGVWDGGTLSTEQRDELGLTDEELELVRKALGRPATWTELGIFAVMWSEHCSYKSSKKLLITLPTKGPRILQGPGENAGVVALDDTWAICFKVESHNHPSAIEPYQGAATGVGGILRDIFTMGARPIALMNSLHFGRPDTTSDAARNDAARDSEADRKSADRVRHLVRGVVSGIADYGNCVGIPTVGGETHFHPYYSGNPLVNVMAVGVVKRDAIMKAQATTPGARVLYYGNATGMDGLHGATFSSAVFAKGGEDKRGAVQVGDPFMEKKIMEATLELIEANAALGIQDMGAAGLTCSSCEMAGRGGTGIVVNLDRVPRRARGLSPYELMLSESQERMLAVVAPQQWEKAKAILAKWDLEAYDLGEITSDGIMRILGSAPEGEEATTPAAREHAASAASSRKYATIEHAAIPVSSLTDAAPLYDLPARQPSSMPAWTLNESELPLPNDAGAALLALLESPIMASRRWIWEQYDTMVGTATGLVTLGGDAAVLRVDGARAGIAISMDSCARAGFLDPKRGAMLAVAEAARNVACVGASPVAVTNNLNFGNPRNPEIFWQMRESVEGLGEACRAFETPVTGGNVSLFNETDGTAILPTLTIGMLGIIDDPMLSIGIAPSAGRLFLVGGDQSRLKQTCLDQPSLAGSAYLYQAHNLIAGRPEAPDFLVETALQRLLVEGVRQRLITAAHDVADGGVAVALAEMAAAGRVGVNVSVPKSARIDTTLFGEGPGRVIVAVSDDSLATFESLVQAHHLSITPLGSIGGHRFIINPGIDLSLDAIQNAGTSTFSDLFDVIQGGIPRPMKIEK